MARGKPPTEQQIEALKSVWLSNPGKSWAEVHRRFERKHGKGIIGVRKAQYLIPTFSLTPSGVPIPPFEYKDWKPWNSGKGNPETRAFLVTLDTVSVAVQRRHLYHHEADWGMRLRASLQGLTPYDQLCFVSLYAIEEVQAHFGGGEPLTGDLDTILAYKPWLPENAHAYGMAIMARLARQPLTGSPFAPSPPRGSIEELSIEDSVKNFYAGKAWETLRVDLRLPWHYRELSRPSDPFRNFELFPREDVAVQFWMGENPIFEKPDLHGIYGLLKPTSPEIEAPAEPITNEEEHE